jgi:hypothetical protein
LKFAGITAGGGLFLLGCILSQLSVSKGGMTAADVYWPAAFMFSGLIIMISAVTSKKLTHTEEISVPPMESRSNTQESTQQQVSVQNITYNTITNINDSSVVSDQIVNFEIED